MLGSYISPFANNIANDNELHQELLPLMNSLTMQLTSLPLIRLGSKFDGGYILVDKDYSDSFVISAGISNNNDFEIDFANKGGYGHQIDFSVKNAPLNHPNLTFSSTRLVGEGNQIDIFDISLDEVYSKYIESSKYATSPNILKMDIEGSEWDILKSSKSIEKFDQILLELHYLDRLAKPLFKEDYMKSLKRLLEGFFPVAIAGNNCCGFITIGGFSIPRVIEMTLLNRKNYPVRSSETNLPSLNLITRNYPQRAPLVLKNWSNIQN